MTNLIIIVLSFFIGAISALLVSRYGPQLGLVDIPSERSSHDKPVPKGGGIGIPLAAGVTTFLFTHTGVFLISIAFLLSIISLVNDRAELPVSLRLSLGYICAVAFVIYNRNNIASLTSGDFGAEFAWFIYLFFALFIITTANFFNFMDGINGIAGFEALISFSLLGIFAFQYKNSHELGVMAIIIASASIGFLFFNFPKAKVFMGDAGSIFLGFVFAGLIIHLAATVKDFLLLLLFQSLFYIDCISTIFIRAYYKENILKAHRQHLYQKLVHCSGHSHQKVAISYGFGQLIIGCIGFFLFSLDLIYLILLWSFLFIAYWGILIKFKLIKY